MSAQFQPSSQQQYQSGLAQAELLEAMDRLKHEGFDWRVILSGAFGATAHLVAAHAGHPQVPVCFARWSAATMHLAEKP